MTDTIAHEAKTRVQSKIALTFTGGYSTGRLFDSIYYRIESNTIVVKSTQNYFTILNAGYASFDMKEALMKKGRPIPIRLPGGRVIFRWPGEVKGKQRKNFGDYYDANDNFKRKRGYLNTHLRTKKGVIKAHYPSKNWIHPGYQGKHIYEQVEAEMKPWVKQYVTDQVWALLNTIPDVPFTMTQEGYMYYSRRDNQGRFS